MYLLIKKSQELTRIFSRKSSPFIPMPTSFEIDLRVKFEAIKKRGNSNILIVTLLPYKNTDGYDYEFKRINRGQNPWHAINWLSRNNIKTVIALDLNKDFSAQWPIRNISSPHDLRDYPVIQIPSMDNISPASISNRTGFGKKPVPKFIRGIVN